jgi:hypothetical protein
VSVSQTFYVLTLTPTLAALGIVCLIACITLAVIMRLGRKGVGKV